MNPKFCYSLMISILNATLLLAYDYPIKPFNSQHKIIATLAESRVSVSGSDSLKRFHNGVDIVPKTLVSSDSFWLVYSLRSDTMLRLSYQDEPQNNGVYDNDMIFWYLHIYNRIDSAAFATAFVDSIGRIRSDMVHCHLIERNASTLQYINPLRSTGLSPFIDTVPPIIESESFKRQGNGIPLNKDTLNDSVDIVVRVYDPRVDTTGAGAGRGMGIYKVQYQILDTLKNPISGAINFYQFDSLPLNSPTARYIFVYHDSTVWDSGRFYYWATNAPFSDTANQYWNTKQHINRQWYEPPAESIEVAKFKDGNYWVKVLAYDIKSNADSESVLVHVDNFPPRVKKVDPTNWYSFVPTKKHKVWCTFSEAMDTTTLTASNIKIHSIKSDSISYPITNITYIKDSFKLYLTVDSFRFKDTVQVRLLDGVKDLAGKSIQGSKQTVVYSWNFIVGVIQLTDNDVNDLSPDVYHGKITWARGQIGNDYGEIMLYDFYQGTTNQISSGNDSNFTPVIWSNLVAWRRRVASSTYKRSVFYYNGSTTQEIAQATCGRYSLAIDSTGIVWRSCKRNNYNYRDTMLIEYYRFSTGQILDLDSFREYYGRGYGRVDISGEKIVWDHAFNESNSRNDIYLYDGNGIQNITNAPDSSNRIPVISDGQVAWVRQAESGRPTTIWFNDGLSNRRISEGSFCYSPEINKGKVLWYEDEGSYQYTLHYYTGRKDTLLSQGSSTWNYYFIPWSINNNHAVWTQYKYTATNNATCYDGDAIINLVNDSTSNTSRIEVHDGFVVYDAWDGHDYEIYLYLADTLFTPPAIVKNLRNEIISAKASIQQVKLTWNRNLENDLDGYKVYRSDIPYNYSTSPYATINTLDTVFIDTIPLVDTNYYVVTAFDETTNEGGFSNQTTAIIDIVPPKSPNIVKAEKVNNNLKLTWNKVTQDTVGNPESVNYYVVYRDTAPSFVPDAGDSIGKVTHLDTVYTDSGVINSSNSYYYLTKAVDNGNNKSYPSNIAFKFNKFLNENPSTSDRNWVSLPYKNNYSTVSDISDEMSPIGSSIIKFTKIYDNQTYDNWMWDPDFEEWYGSNFSILEGRSYEFEAVKDTTTVLAGVHDPSYKVPLNENPGYASDRNWVSIPYNKVYATVSDLVEEYSSEGEPVVLITNLRNDQLYESWFWDEDFGWYGTDFTIERGRGYEFIATCDTTWKPTVYTNRTAFYLAKKGTNHEYKEENNLYRLPVWPNAKSLPNAEVLFKPDNRDINLPKKDVKRPRPSHLITANIKLDTTKTINRISFTAYRVRYPEQALFEGSVGCGVKSKKNQGLIWAEISNLSQYWQHNEEAIIVVELLVNNELLYGTQRFKIDSTLHIQHLSGLKFTQVPKVEYINNTKSQITWRMTGNGVQSNIVGYSIYDGNKRLNNEILSDNIYNLKNQGNFEIRPVFLGGYETVISLNSSIEEQESRLTPTRFSLSPAIPNPFTKFITITYALPKTALVNLEIFDVTGRKIKTMIKGQQNVGYYSLLWNNKDENNETVASGIYFIRFNARVLGGTEEFSTQIKILSVK